MHTHPVRPHQTRLILHTMPGSSIWQWSFHETRWVKGGTIPRPVSAAAGSIIGAPDYSTRAAWEAFYAAAAMSLGRS